MSFKVFSGTAIKNWSNVTIVTGEKRLFHSIFQFDSSLTKWRIKWSVHLFMSVWFTSNRLSRLMDQSKGVEFRFEGRSKSLKTDNDYFQTKARFILTLRRLKFNLNAINNTLKFVRNIFEVIELFSWVLVRYYCKFHCISLKIIKWQ